jgi:hypothetical protein
VYSGKYSVKYWSIFTRLHGATTKKTAMFLRNDVSQQVMLRKYTEIYVSSNSTDKSLFPSLFLNVLIGKLSSVCQDVVTSSVMLQSTSWE